MERRACLVLLQRVVMPLSIYYYPVALIVQVVHFLGS